MLVILFFPQTLLVPQVQKTVRRPPEVYRHHPVHPALKLREVDIKVTFVNFAEPRLTLYILMLSSPTKAVLAYMSAHLVLKVKSKRLATLTERKQSVTLPNCLFTSPKVIPSISSHRSDGMRR